MKTLSIDATDETPRIFFDGNTGVFSISGKSYPENAVNFYQPVFQYIENYKQNPHSKTLLEFNWMYYNTSTAQHIIRIITTLKEVAGTDFSVKWICREDYELTIEKGEEIKDVLDIDMEIITTQ